MPKTSADLFSRAASMYEDPVRILVMALFVRTIGIARARTKIGLANLVCNMRRLLWLERQAAPA